MLKLRKLSAVVGLVLLLGTLTVSAQGPLQKQVFYTINADHALKVGGYILPPGKYELFQINQNNPNLFALYRENRMHSPIAMIYTTRIDYHTIRNQDKTTIMLTIEENNRGRDNLPVLKGWTIPGFDGWEIISVVEKKRGLLARAR